MLHCFCWPTDRPPITEETVPHRNEFGVSRFITLQVTDVTTIRSAVPERLRFLGSVLVLTYVVFAHGSQSEEEQLPVQTPVNTNKRHVCS